MNFLSMLNAVEAKYNLLNLLSARQLETKIAVITEGPQPAEPLERATLGKGDISSSE